ncbi:unnamed protein product, partial [Ceratitis capitata]
SIENSWNFHTQQHIYNGYHLSNHLTVTTGGNVRSDNSYCNFNDEGSSISTDM